MRGHFLRAASRPFDPYFANVSLLLHGNGANGSTTITDNSPSPKTLTANGNAQISTAQSKFGGSSIAFDGNGDFVTTPNSAAWNFGTGDLTIEAWVYIAGNSAPDLDNTRGATICATWTAATPISGWALTIRGSSATTGTGLQFATWNSGNATYQIANTTISQSTWNHLAVSISGGTRRLFLNGSPLTSSSSSIGSGSTPAESYGNPLRIGGAQTSNYKSELNGYIDELRITKGVARYNASFTLPIAPFADL